MHNPQCKTLVEHLQQQALMVANGAAIGCRRLDQEEESSVVFEINIQGQPMKVTIIAHTLDK